MNEFTRYCTPEQTREALELGAPIDTNDLEIGFYEDWELDIYKIVIIDERYYYLPTVEEMIGWLRSKGILFRFDDEDDYWSICDANGDVNDDSTPLRWYSWIENKELRAVDAALEYLENKK